MNPFLQVVPSEVLAAVLSSHLCRRQRCWSAWMCFFLKHLPSPVTDCICPLPAGSPLGGGSPSTCAGYKRNASVAPCLCRVSSKKHGLRSTQLRSARCSQRSRDSDPLMLHGHTAPASTLRATWGLASRTPRTPGPAASPGARMPGLPAAQSPQCRTWPVSAPAQPAGAGAVPVPVPVPARERAGQHARGWPGCSPWPLPHPTGMAGGKEPCPAQEERSVQGACSVPLPSSPPPEAQVVFLECSL